jgi:hypothetical protein
MGDCGCVIGREREDADFALEFIEHHIACPKCAAACTMRDHAAERNWCHLDAIQLQTTPTARAHRIFVWDWRGESKCRSVGPAALKGGHSPV